MRYNPLGSGAARHRTARRPITPRTGTMAVDEPGPRPVGLSEAALSGGVRLYLANWRTILPLILIAFAATAVTRLFAPSQALSGRVDDPALVWARFWSSMGSLALTLGLLLLVTWPITMAQLLVFGRRHLGLSVTWTGALRGAMGRYLPYLGASLLIGLVMVGLLLPFFLLGLSALVLYGMNTGTDAQFLVGFSGLCLACGCWLAVIVATVYISTRLIFVHYEVVLGGQGPVAALRRSWVLTRGMVLRIFGIQLVVSLPLIFPITIQLMVDVAVRNLVAAPAADAEPMLLAVWLTNTALIGFYTPVIAAVDVVLWYLLRAEREPAVVAGFAGELP
jgi:hypothetical protein